MKTYVLLLLAITFLPCLSMGATCYAGTSAALETCAANAASSDVIEITANITLQPGDTVLLNGKTNVTINGNSYTIAEHASRTDGFMMYVYDSVSIYLNDIVLTSPTAYSYCRHGGTGYYLPGCYPLIRVQDSDYVFIDNIDMDAHKAINFQIVDSRGVSVDNSSFANGAAMNITVNGSEYVEVKNSYLAGAGSSAIVLADSAHVWVGLSTFVDNHWDTQFGGHWGSQIALDDYGPLTDIDITGNTVLAGISTVSAGIEVAAFENGTLDGVTIMYNDFEDHWVSAVHFVPPEPTSDIRNVVIANNQFINNDKAPGQVTPYDHAGIDLRSDGNYSGGIWTTGNFNGTAKTCSLNGGSSCSISIQWSSTNISNPTVCVRNSAYGSTRTTFSTGASGTVTATGITTAGKIFELVSGACSYLPVASINVKAVP